MNHQQASNTFSAYTHGVLGAESITLELGKARPFGENAGLDLTELEAVIADLLEGTESVEVPAPQVFRVARSVIKHSEPFRLFLPTGCQNFTPLPPTIAWPRMASTAGQSPSAAPMCCSPTRA